MLVKHIPHQLIIINVLLKLHLCIDCAIIIIIVIIIIVAISQYFIIIRLLYLSV